MGACRYCRSERGELVLDLGDQPACEYFPPLDDPGPDPVAPLRLWLCADCGLAQLADDADLPDQPAGVEPRALAEQRRDAVRAVVAAGLLPSRGRVVEGPTPHGGSWLPLLAEHGLDAAGDGPADVVVDGSFGLMHATDQAAALDGLLTHLAPDGLVLFQWHTLAAILREGQWNAVRHGHYAYYSAPVVQRMLADRGLGIVSAWTFPLYGGTVLVAARRGGRPDASVGEVITVELAAGVRDPQALRGLQRAMDAATSALRQLLDSAAAAGERVHGYSAASRAVALLNSTRTDHDRLLSVADLSPAKQGCRMPGTRVPIVSPDRLVAASPDTVLVFVSELIAEVREAYPQIEAAGGRWADAGTGAVATA
ncbi:Putative zinc binding domain-containing protein [Pseudonocardia thermophila]|uniref:Putative zinc binding domain-containing protein n=1 Tax=Pseudonocardia thermophila TaxID=1848 RepID=A0A1M6YW06_PSETH|nr:methyltransferase domain-containing protein [Pseudonocardia thermophila]SHL22229.1 Putative zinc binding domain-containing protein [Pseudonocardia thermophila]